MNLSPISPRQTNDWGHFEAALTAADLPVADLDYPGQHFFALRLDGEALAFGGFLDAEENALLRSIVVLKAARGRGFGALVVAGLVNALKQAGVGRAWLLTTTATDFFVGQGFRLADRASAPGLIRATPQFSGVCPDSAALLTRDL